MGPAAAFRFDAAAVYRSLVKPPFRLTLDRIARLTDLQIERVYHAAAEEMARDQAAGGGGRGPAGGFDSGGGADPFADGLPPKDEFVAGLLRTDGRTREHWEAVYDRLAAEVAGQKG